MNVKKLPTDTFHQELTNLYSWRQVAERTEKVYDYCMTTPTPNMLDRLKTSHMWGSMIGMWAMLYCIFESITMMLTEILWPESSIDIARSFSSPVYNQDIKAYGDHKLYVDS
jgi:phosphatidylinositol glycan class A protein